MKQAIATTEVLWRVYDDNGNDNKYWVWYESQAIEAFAREFQIAVGHILYTENTGESRIRYGGTKEGFR